MYPQYSKEGVVMSKSSIYPDMARENHFSFMYSKIAIENYCEAKKLYNTIAKNNYDICDGEYRLQMEEKIIIVCVFSAMTIESFLNDYAASCLGDSDFYDNFDKLSVISKLQLIAKFILKKDIDKSQSYYSNLKALIKHRDWFVHNKSKKSSFQGYTYEEMQEFDDFIKDNNILETTPTLDKTEIKEDFAIAQTSIKAMRDIAKFFEESDDNCTALATFFKKYDPKKSRATYYNEVIEEFNI